MHEEPDIDQQEGSMTQPQVQVAMIPCQHCGVIRAGIPGVVLRQRKGLAVAAANGQVQVDLVGCPICLFRIQYALDAFCGVKHV